MLWKKFSFWILYKDHLYVISQLLTGYFPIVDTSSYFADRWYFDSREGFTDEYYLLSSIYIKQRLEDSQGSPFYTYPYDSISVPWKSKKFYALGYLSKINRS